MPLTQLAPPYPIFTDKGGNPLDAGYLYFGKANQNPETNPVTVYYDRALTQPVAQPVRTSNGYVMRNGSPALIYADEEFSVTVRDKTGALIIYSPIGFGVVPGISSLLLDNAAKDVSALLADTSFSYNTALSGSIQVSPGDILRTLSEGFAYEVAAAGVTDQSITTAGGVKLYALPQGNAFKIEAFGAVGDGVTDDSSAFVKAINAMPSSDGFDILLEAKTYKISSAAFYLTRPIRIRGQSRQENMTTLDFSASATVVNAPYNAHIIAVHSNNISGSSSFSTPIQLPAGQVGTYGLQAGLLDLTVKCNPAVSDGNGVFANVAMHCERVRVIDANLHNWVIAANTTQLSTRGGAAGPTGLDIGGNTNNGVYIDCWARNALNGDGIHISGADANQNVFVHPDCVGNKGWGVQDDTLHGNLFLGLHTGSNQYGAGISRPASPNRSMWLMPYAEGGQGTDNSNTVYTMSARALILGPSGDYQDGALPCINAENDGIVSKATFSVMDAADTEDTGGTFGRLGRGELSLRTTDGQLFKIERSGSAYTSIKYRNTDCIMFNNTSNGVIGLGVPYFPSGFALSTRHRQTAADAIPTTGTWARGEIVWNNLPSAGGKVGWVCTSGGTPGTWKAFGAIDP